MDKTATPDTHENRVPESPNVSNEKHNGETDAHACTGLAWDIKWSDEAPVEPYLDAAPYVVVYKYALSTEILFREVAKNNAPGIHNAVTVVDKPKAFKTATSLIDKVANFINATGVIK